MLMAEKHVAVMDMKLRQPACVLLQAAMGGDPAITKLFYSEKWLLAPTEDMQRVAGTMEQWQGLAKEVNAS